MTRDELVVGLDIGTTKVCAVIGERNEHGTLEITGVGTSPSTGLRKGVVVNIEATLRSVRAAVEAAEMMSGKEVHSCWTGIGGSHIDGINSRGVVAVGKERETREIGQEDIKRVLEAARAVVLPLDRQIIEVIPLSFIVDDQRGIKDPLDMIGVRLEVEAHIITCSVTGGQNLVKCVNRAGYTVNDLVLQSLAAGRAALMPDEIAMGAALIDLGGGTTDVLVYVEGAPYYTITIPAGGAQVTNDISMLKSISPETAEKIKIEAGCCWEPYLEGEDDIIVPGVGGRAPQPIPRRDILGIIRPRMEETFVLIKERLDKLLPGKRLGGGIVLTGGGAQLLGASELASEIFGMRARIGAPLPVGGLVPEYCSPAYATAVGLVMEGADRSGQSASRPDTKPDPGESLIKKLILWFQKEFF